MTMRPCIEDGCPTLTDRTRCGPCTKSRDLARGTRQARGYDADYDAQRRAYQARMDAGQVYVCWRCVELGKPPHDVNPHDWHLGHSKDRLTIRGPQCPASNLNTMSNTTPPPDPPQAPPRGPRGRRLGGARGSELPGRGERPASS